MTLLALLLAAALVTDTLASPFTWSANGATALLEIVVAGGALAAGVRHRDARPTGRARGRSLLLFGTIGLGLVVVELVSLAHSSRRSHPTLSSLAHPLTVTTPGRFVLFLVAGLAGWWLAR